jgi:hypothetical protein
MYIRLVRACVRARNRIQTLNYSLAIRHVFFIVFSYNCFSNVLKLRVKKLISYSIQERNPGFSSYLIK